MSWSTVPNVAIAIGFMTLCSNAGAQTTPPVPAKGRNAAGGIRWTVPSRWSEGPASAMRVATYEVPASKGAGPAECPVFFFGPGQGGSVEANVERWARQFEGTPKAGRTTRTVAGLSVTVVELEGTYLSPGGAMMTSQGKRPGYRLRGAIVEAPRGNVFFKLTGPAATVAASGADFEALITSIRRE